MRDKTVLVTGATDGLGRALAGELGDRGATVIVHGRDPDRVAEVTSEVRSRGGTGSEGVVADFADLAAVRRLAAEIDTGWDRLDVLVNNAGIGGGSSGARETSKDGYELVFAVNYLATFLLTESLVPLLKRSAPSRVVNVASVGQAPVNFDDVMLERSYDPWRAYAQSKLAMIAWGFDLAERLDPAAVTVTSLHPATLMPTKLVTQWFGRTSSTLAEGTEATLRLVVSRDLDGVTGRYFDGTREARAADQAYDADARRRLREISQRLTAST